MTWRTLAAALVTCGAAGLSTFSGSPIETTAASIAERRPAPAAQDRVAATTPVEAVAAGHSDQPGSAISSAEVSTTEVPAVEPASTKASPDAERGPAPAEPDPVISAAPVRVAAADDSILPASVHAPAAVSAADMPAGEPVSTEPVATPPPQTGMQLASVPTGGAVDEGLEPTARASAPSGPCVTDACIDAYLWSLYERTPKIDTNKVPERTKVSIRKNGKTRTVTQTVTTYVVADFAWKDPAAAERSGMSLKDYVIGGMDQGFRRKLYGALRAMDDAGLMPGITSAFRDDYRQSIAAGLKAAADSSYHGGSRRGGYGHGLAADLVSLKGDTRAERAASSDTLWQWIDAHEKELGIGRPYRDRDPPHVGPIDGTEYIVKRALASAHKRTSPTNKAEKPRLEATKRQAVRTDGDASKHANAEKTSKLGSLQGR
jgi:hypothetical protein